MNFACTVEEDQVKPGVMSKTGVFCRQPSSWEY